MNSFYQLGASIVAGHWVLLAGGRSFLADLPNLRRAVAHLRRNGWVRDIAGEAARRSAIPAAEAARQ